MVIESLRDAVFGLLMYDSEQVWIAQRSRGRFGQVMGSTGDARWYEVNERGGFEAGECALGQGRLIQHAPPGTENRSKTCEKCHRGYLAMSKGRLLLGVGVGVKLQGPFLEVTGSEALLLVARTSGVPGSSGAPRGDPWRFSTGCRMPYFTVHVK